MFAHLSVRITLEISMTTACSTKMLAMFLKPSVLIWAACCDRDDLSTSVNLHRLFNVTNAISCNKAWSFTLCHGQHSGQTPQRVAAIIGLKMTQSPCLHAEDQVTKKATSCKTGAGQGPGTKAPGQTRRKLKHIPYWSTWVFLLGISQMDREAIRQPFTCQFQASHALKPACEPPIVPGYPASSSSSGPCQPRPSFPAYPGLPDHCQEGSQSSWALRGDVWQTSATIWTFVHPLVFLQPPHHHRMVNAGERRLPQDRK